MTTTLQLNPIPAAGAEAAPAASAATTKPAAGVNVVDIVKKGIESGADAATLTGLYLKLRNAKKDLDEQAKSKTKPLVEALDMIENHFLTKMNEMGVDSLKNAAGTPYKQESVSITVADNSAFVDFVLSRALQALPVSEAARESIKNAIIESGQLALIEARASKTACETFLEETQELPAGLNRRSEFKVNVRAS